MVPETQDPTTDLEFHQNEYSGIELLCADDYTCYPALAALRTARNHERNRARLTRGRAPHTADGDSGGGVDTRKPYAGPVRLLSDKDAAPQELAKGRALLCSCYSGACASLTLRREKVTKDDLGCKEPTDVLLPVSEELKRSPFQASDYRSESTPVPFRTIVEILASLLFKTSATDFKKEAGLLVVSGSTSAGKSQILRGIIDEYLYYYNLRRKQTRTSGKTDPKDRRPHLLTIEDPVEKWLARQPGDARNYGIDYTPRELGKDTADLEAALQDALRQTPALVYVGETRNDRDWKELVHFAGTGHLIVTTSHAGSLVETMERIMRAVGARTPVERGQVAQRLLGLVHLEPLAHSAGGLSQTVVVPGLWRRTSRSVAGLIADGLSSIVPDNPRFEFAKDGTAHLTGLHCKADVIGRFAFAQMLAKRHAGTTSTERILEEEQFLARAFQRDLKGV